MGQKLATRDFLNDPGQQMSDEGTGAFFGFTYRIHSAVYVSELSMVVKSNFRTCARGQPTGTGSGMRNDLSGTKLNQEKNGAQNNGHTAPGHQKADSIDLSGSQQLQVRPLFFVRSIL